MVAIGQGLSGFFVGDNMVKACLACVTFEQMEIASYKILIAAAQEAGDDETRRVCEDILRQEQAMLSWLDEHLAPVTQQYLARERMPRDREALTHGKVTDLVL